MLDLDAIDVDEIANALADQTDDEHRWLIDPRTGEIAFWTSDLGIDGENPGELERLSRTLDGKGAFRRSRWPRRPRGWRR